MKVKEESTKAGLYLNIKKTKILTTEEIQNFNMENKDIKIIKDFAYPGSVINLNGDCSLDIKRRLRLRRAAMEELGKIIKSKDVPLETKAKLIPNLIFPTTTYRYKSLTVKKSERRKKRDSCEIWCWTRALWIPGTARKANKCVLEQMKPEISLKAKMTKLKQSYFRHIMRRQVSLEKTITLERIEFSRKRGRPNLR